MKMPKNLFLILLFSLTFTLGGCSSSSDDSDMPTETTDDTTVGDSTDDATDDPTGSDTDNFYVKRHTWSESISPENQTVLDFNYDANNRLTERVTSIFSGIANTHTYVYEDNRLAKIVWSNPDGLSYDYYTFEYNSSGKLEKMQMTIDGNVYGIFTYTYDALGRQVDRNAYLSFSDLDNDVPSFRNTRVYSDDLPDFYEEFFYTLNSSGEIVTTVARRVNEYSSEQVDLFFGEENSEIPKTVFLLQLADLNTDFFNFKNYPLSEDWLDISTGDSDGRRTELTLTINSNNLLDEANYKLYSIVNDDIPQLDRIYKFEYQQR